MDHPLAPPSKPAHVAVYEEGTTQVVVHKVMMTSPTVHLRAEPIKRPSRLQRLSSMVLSPLRTYSKSSQDGQSSVLRKPTQPQFAQSAMDLRTKPMLSPPHTAASQTSYASPLLPPPVPMKEQRSVSQPRPSNRLTRRMDSPDRSIPPASPSGHIRNMSGSGELPARGRRDSGGIMGGVLSSGKHVRTASNPIQARPRTANSSEDEKAGSKIVKRRSGFGLLRSRDSSPTNKPPLHQAWTTVSGSGVVKYELDRLLDGKKVPEIWHEKPDHVLVYLFPGSAGRGPSFKVPQVVFSSSEKLLAHIQSASQEAVTYSDAGSEETFTDISSGSSAYSQMASRAPSHSSASSKGSFGSGSNVSGDLHCMFPTGLGKDFFSAKRQPRDVQRLIDVRNLFAFLTGQPIVCTHARPSTYAALLGVGSIVREFNFTDPTGETSGAEVNFSLGFLIDIEGFADVRDSPTRAVQAIVLAERLRHAELYTEAFAHAVGRYDDVRRLDPSLFQSMTKTTRERLELAYLQLRKRQQSVEHRLENFDFPSIFAGSASSTTSNESKYIRYKAWKDGFLAMRKMLLEHYKSLHGQWPPRANSKKNSFIEGGLNRLVLRGLYFDLCVLYDFLVNRKAVTTRSMDASDDQDTSNIEPILKALRQLLSEYDRSSPPVQPPIPFDVPLLPTIATLNPRFPMLSPQEQHHQATKTLQSHEQMLIVAKSYNQYPPGHVTPFVAEFQAFEDKQAKGKSCQDIADQRIGHWIFLYAVIQALPLLVVDAPGVNWTSGVEYFLCQPLIGNLPWVDSSAVRMEWYGVSKTGGMVSMPSDVINNGVEAIYRRSHCWTACEKFLTAPEFTASPTFIDDAHSSVDQDEGLLSPLAPPPGFADNAFDFGPSGGPNAGTLPRVVDTVPSTSSTLVPPTSRAGRRTSYRHDAARQSMLFGLEKLSVTPDVTSQQTLSPAGTPVSAGMRGVSPMGASRRSSVVPNTATPSGTATFDDILSKIDYSDKKNKKSNKKK